MIGRPRKKRSETSTVEKEKAQMKAPSIAHHNLPGFLGALAAAAALILALGVGSASAAQIETFDGTILDSGGEPFTQAGGHPDTVTSGFELGTYVPEGSFFPAPDGKMKDITVELPPGLLGDPTATPKCTALQLYESFGNCPADTQIGELGLPTSTGGESGAPLYNMVPDPGEAAKFGANVIVNLQLAVTVRSDDYGLTVKSLYTPSALYYIGARPTFWGVPADYSGAANRTGFMRMPTSCTGPMKQTLRVNTWEEPGNFLTASFLSHDNNMPPNPIGNTGCENVPFDPTASVQPLSRKADSPSGLNVDINLPTDGIKNPTGISQSDLKKVEINFPEGMAVNPSAADGLTGCSPDQVGVGTDSKVSCPESSKIGTTEITTPILNESLTGSLYLAEQDNNPFNSTLALYLVAENAQRGITIKLPGDVQTNGSTGQLKVTFDNNPQLPLSNLNVKLKSGNRAPLFTPPACGAYQIMTKLTPWSGTAPVTRTSSFDVNQDCNTGGFNPGFAAGTTQPVAGGYAPFGVDVTRNDGEQNVSAIGVTLPKGVAAKIAGVPLCPEANAAAGTCPASSQVGSVAVAAGAGPEPVWVPQPGKAPTAVYLTGPYKGQPYGLVFRVPVQAGPFDLGTVSVRAAISVNPETAQVSVASDSLPQILKGIPISYRHIHIGIFRSGFMLNPTNCHEQATASTIVAANGGAATPASRFQVGSCGNLNYKPKLYTRIWGKTNRGAHPKFRAVLEERKGNANVGRTALTLPRSEFLDQAHIKTICTRVQFAANACPKASVYGWAKARTPLFTQMFEGPVYLRSSNHKLPDLVAALKGPVAFNLVARIDSKNKGIRNTFESPPDVPVSKFILYMKGGSKGLLVNSRNICNQTYRSNVNTRGQNGRLTTLKPVLKNSRCKKGKKKKK
jgi:hypothetical protein